MLKSATTLIFAIGLSGVAFAQKADVEGDLEYGQYLSAECVTCHSALGKDKGIPSIIGWNQQNFIAVVNAYKSKKLENPAMQMIAGRLDDEQIASLGLYFASLSKSE